MDPRHGLRPDCWYFCRFRFDGGHSPVGRARTATAHHTEVTGSPPRTTSLAVEAALVGRNRHLRWVEPDSHGYTVLDVRREHVRMNWYFLADRTRSDTPAALAKTVTVRSGTQRIG